MSKTLVVRYVRSAAEPGDFPEPELPEVAFVGRSNVGKSSLLNCLTGTKRLAFVSKSPGRTQVVNFFRVGELMFVDLPGYGFAKAPLSVRKKWEGLVTSYLFQRQGPSLVLLLIDARREPLASDLAVRDMLEEAEKTYVVVATKMDKLSGNRARVKRSQLERVFGAAGTVSVVFFSAVTSEGRKELWKVIETHVRAAKRAPKK